MKHRKRMSPTATVGPTNTTGNAGHTQPHSTPEPAPSVKRKFEIELDPEIANWIEGVCAFGPGPKVRVEEGIVLLLKLAKGLVFLLAADHVAEMRRRDDSLN